MLAPISDYLAARFWQSKEGADRVDQLPTVAARHEAMKGLTQLTRGQSPCEVIGLDYTVLERRPIRVASVADYRK